METCPSNLDPTLYCPISGYNALSMLELILRSPVTSVSTVEGQAVARRGMTQVFLKEQSQFFLDSP